jgi:FkbM family methyltransferase
VDSRGATGSVAKTLSGALDRVSFLRAVFKSPPALYLVRTIRASQALCDRPRFVALQLAPSRAAAHRLRDSGLRVYLRHRTRDIDIFREVFDTGYGPSVYEPPASLAALLDAKNAPTVLDLGANIGLFGLYALGRWPDARIRSFEPDPGNLPLLNRAILANDLQRQWTVADAAVANHAGSTLFVAGLFAESQLAAVADTAPRAPDATPLQLGRKVVVRTVDLFAEDHDVDLMKMDIEGAEWSILTDPRMSSLGADVIVLEWHTSGCPEPDPRAAAVRLLRTAGYTDLQETHVLSHTGLVWARRGDNR